MRVTGHRSAADAGPAIGRAERSIDAPRTQAAHGSHQQLASAGRRLIARRASGGIGGAGDPLRREYYSPSVSPRL